MIWAILRINIAAWTAIFRNGRGLAKFAPAFPLTTWGCGLVILTDSAGLGLAVAAASTAVSWALFAWTQSLMLERVASAEPEGEQE